MPRQSSAAAKSDASHEIEVDTDQADIKKAINREAPKESDERPTRGNAFQSDDADPTEQRHSEWLEKNRAVQKRIGRMQRNFDQKLANEQAERQRERREFQQQLEALKVTRGSDTSASDAAHEAEIAVLQAQIEAAHEAGNSKEVARLTTLISRKEAARMQAKTEALLQQQRRQADPPAQERSQAKRTSKADRFIAQTEWWGDPDLEAEQSYANSLFARLTNEDGMDPESDELFRTINKQLKKKFPDLDVKDFTKGGKDEFDPDDEEEGLEEKPQRRAPVQNFKDRGNEVQQGRRTGTRLTEADITLMKAMKMDPNDDKAVLAYAKEKRQLEAAE